MAEEKKKGFDLAAALGAVSKMDTGAEGREQLQYINIKKIRPDERNFYEISDVEDLAANIELVGLQQPLRVRPDQADSGAYIVVSGHRRLSALTKLYYEAPTRWDMIPCIVEQAAGAADEVEAMLQELRLIYGNSDTRRMSSADLSKQAERVEMLLYQLKEAGVEFPGRMRDHVAEACKVSASKLGRLKVIRENLIEDLKKDWERGALSESVAYAFAKQPPEVQRLTVLAITNYGSTNTERKWWQEWRVKTEAETISKELKPKKGPKGSCEGCDATQQRLKRIIGHSQYNDHCGDGKCCHCCPNIGTCEFVCSHLSNEVAKAKVSAQAKKAKEKEQKQKEDAKQVAPTVRLWKRFGEARARAGLTFEEYAKKADARGFIREKKVADFEQGRKITPSSGGLPYAGGNGVDEWRIRPLVKAADALGCSVDYLLCRTDEPGMAKAERPRASVPSEPTWQIGIPKHTGTYYCRIRFEEGQTMTLNLDYGSFNARWSHPATGEEVPYEVLGWWPLPEAAPEDAEDDDEGDDEDNMDALWYGHEDDDDYLAESSEVLGAEEGGQE